MDKVSIIVPSRNEIFLSKTIDDLFAKARGDIEVIAVLDGYWVNPRLQERDNLIIIHRGEAKGLRAANNAGAAVATGKWLMKCDAHCMFDEGFDEKLKADCDMDWIVIPRRYSLDAELWERKTKTPIDYHYLDCPMTNQEYFQFHGVPWGQRGKERDVPEYEIDDTPSFQGSMWFMSAEHFHKRLKGMSEVGYGTFSQEPQEIGNKTWLGGGRVVTNKRTWYAHLHKGAQYGRGYRIGGDSIRQGHLYSATYWMSNLWEERIHDIEWLIEKFHPMPGWPDNWMELLEKWRKESDNSRILAPAFQSTL